MARPTIDIQGIVQVGTLDADVVNAQKQTFGGGFGVDASGNLTANSVSVGPYIPLPGLPVGGGAILGTPAASANLGLLNVGPGPFDGATSGFFAGSALGTLEALNAAAGFGGNLANWQVAGVSQFSVTAAGLISAGRSLTLTHATQPKMTFVKTNAVAQSWAFLFGDNFSVQDATSGLQPLAIVQGAPGNSILIPGTGVVSFSQGLTTAGQGTFGSSINTGGSINLTTNDAFIKLQDNGFAIAIQAGGPRPIPLQATSTLTFPDLALGTAVPASGWLLGAIIGTIGHGVQFLDAYGAMGDAGYPMNAPRVNSLGVIADIGGGVAGQLILSNAVGIGNGAATNMQSPIKGTGGGPTSAVLVTDWIKIYDGATTKWLPAFT